MDALKASKQPLGAEAIWGLNDWFRDFAPPVLLGPTAAINFSTRLFNLLVTNFPGPQIPFYVLGRELTAIYPVGFLAHRHAPGDRDPQLQRPGQLRPPRRPRARSRTPSGSPPTSAPPSRSCAAAGRADSLPAAMATSWQEMIDLGSRASANASAAPEAEPEQRRGVFRRLRESLSKSRQALAEEISASLFDRIDEETWERLEEALILADAGAPTTAAVVERLEHEVDSGAVPADGDAGPRPPDRDPRRGRLDRPRADRPQRRAGGADDGRRQRHRQDDDDRQDRLAPEQGDSASRWCSPPATPTAPPPPSSWPSGRERAGAELVRGQEGADPGAVAFDAISAARARGADVVIVDTAGRLHTQGNLMDELAKVRRVIAKQIPEAPHETLISIDATTGQNGLRQAKVFSEAVEVDGVVLTKLDGTAKGGIALAIATELGIPVKLIGVGETLEDLRPFDPARVRPRPARRVAPASKLGDRCSTSSQTACRRPSPTSARAAS